MTGLPLALAALSLLGCAQAAPPQDGAGRAPAAGAVAKGCGDLLGRLGRKPEGARYTGCAAVPDDLGAPVRATYDVAGRDAAAVEAYLIRAVGLKPLKRSCCQWDSAPVGFVDPQRGSFMIAMVSDETPVSRREDWGQIKTFRITVEMTTEPY
jgi:hypothetical protein